MKQISETELITTTIDDLNKLIPSDKNRSSFLDVEEGSKRGCSRIATIIGKKRAEKWARMFENGLKFSRLAHLPVWDNGDGTYTLGDGHTRIDAIKYLCENHGFNVPEISLIIENYKFKSKDEFENEIIIINGTFSGKKWDICEKVDYLMRQGNVYALEIFNLFDYFYDNTGKDVAFNMVVNVFLDSQGSGKENKVLNELTTMTEGNKYAYDFANFFIKLNDKLKNSKQKTKVDIFNQYVFQALYNLFMCVAAKHYDKIDSFYNAIVETLSNNTTKENIRNSKRSSDIVNYIFERIPKTKASKDDWFATMKLVHTMKGMTDISERGGRCITFTKDEK